MNPRHADRRRALDALYQADVMGVRPTAVLDQWRDTTGEEIPEFTASLVRGVEDNREDLDIIIGETATGWSVDRMAAVDRAILRLARSLRVSRRDLEFLHGSDVVRESLHQAGMNAFFPFTPPYHAHRGTQP